MEGNEIQHLIVGRQHYTISNAVNAYWNYILEVPVSSFLEQNKKLPVEDLSSNFNSFISFVNSSTVF